MLKPPFCRQGNKTPILKDILELIPPHKIYCEPFAGSAVVFFNLPKAPQGSILNDLDEDVYTRLKLLQKAPLDINKYEVDLSTSDKLKYFYEYHGNSVNDLLLYHKIISCAGFSNRPVKKVKEIYKSYNPAYFLKHLEQYKKMLAGVKITNKNYVNVMLKYDSPDTFFFIDPPYENTNKSFYKDIDMNYDELSFILQNLKGKFLLTINDSPNIRKIFRQFKIKKINVQSFWQSDNPKIRKELFIMNY
jgi:DNA adenine methylase